MKNTNLTQIDLEKIIKDITDLYNEYNPSDEIDFESLKISSEQRSNDYSNLKFDISEPEEDTYVGEELSDKELNRLAYSRYCCDEDLSSDWKGHSLEPSFSECLHVLISMYKLNAPDVYKAAKVDRRLFSKILSNRDYRPSRDTVICFAIALKLSIFQAEELMKSAGYAFSKSILRDVVIEYYIEKEKYDIDEINEVLYSLNLELLTK